MYVRLQRSLQVGVEYTAAIAKFSLIVSHTPLMWHIHIDRDQTQVFVL